MLKFRFGRRVIGSGVLASAVAGCAGIPQANIVPTIPSPVAPTPTPLAPNQLGVGTTPDMPGGPTVWQKLGISKQQREYCRRLECETPYGKLMARIYSPMSKLSGGLIPPFCPIAPSAAELLDPGAIGANAKVKADKLNAEKRKKAVEALKGVDCHYWPEAEEALIGALRADRNEAVRHTAATVLQQGCCCTKKTIEALSICVTGSDRDGHPCEKSPRVRAAAAVALELCIQRSCCPACPTPECEVAPTVTPVLPVEPLKNNSEKPKDEGEKPKDPEKKDTDKKDTDKKDADKKDADGKGTKVSQVSWVKPGPVADDEDETIAAKKYAKAYYAMINKTKTGEQMQERAKKALATMPPLPVDLSVPAGHPDYEAAGFKTAQLPDTEARPANLLDILTGQAATAPAAAAVAPTRKATPVVVPTPEKPAVVELSPTAVMTPMPTTAPPLAVPKAMPPVVPFVAPKLEPGVPTMTLTPAATRPLPVAPKTLGTPATSSADHSSHVLKMLTEASDVTEMQKAVETLTVADLRRTPQLATALLAAAEYPSEPSLRVACVKAIGRGPKPTPEIAAGLERLTRDTDSTVRMEAMRCSSH